MKGLFEILIDGKIQTFHDYRDIPETFDNVIKFMPNFSEGPHTHDQHEEMSHYTEMLQDLMKREKYNASNN